MKKSWRSNGKNKLSYLKNNHFYIKNYRHLWQLLLSLYLPPPISTIVKRSDNQDNPHAFASKATLPPTNALWKFLVLFHQVKANNERLSIRTSPRSIRMDVTQVGLAAGSVAVVGLAAYKVLRPRFESRVNCWFCSRDFRVKFSEKNSWTCPGWVTPRASISSAASCCLIFKGSLAY